MARPTTDGFGIPCVGLILMDAHRAVAVTGCL